MQKVAEIHQEVKEKKLSLNGPQSYNEKGKLITVPIQTLYDVLDATGPEEVTYTVKNITVSPTVATVAIESSFSKLGKFNDMFSLVKDESGWKIVSKVYDVIKG